MSSERPVIGAQKMYDDIAPKLAECSDTILYGDIVVTGRSFAEVARFIDDGVAKPLSHRDLGHTRG